MKKLLFIFLLLSCCRLAYSQDIKPGTTFGYLFLLHGQSSPLELTINKNTDTLVCNWRIRGLAGGAYVTLPAALDNAQYLSFAQPTPNTAIPLQKETFCMISRSAFKTLVKEHHFTYDNTVFNIVDDVQANPFLVDKKPLDVLHVAAADESMEWWILNDPEFPLVCRIKGNPLGIDYVLKTITQQ